MINLTAQTGRKFSNGSTWHSELFVVDCNEKTATMEIFISTYRMPVASPGMPAASRVSQRVRNICAPPLTFAHPH